LRLIGASGPASFNRQQPVAHDLARKSADLRRFAARRPAVDRRQRQQATDVIRIVTVASGLPNSAAS
jgi:hypothetical protein